MTFIKNVQRFRSPLQKTLIYQIKVTIAKWSNQILLNQTETADIFTRYSIDIAALSKKASIKEKFVSTFNCEVKVPKMY